MKRKLYKTLTKFPGPWPQPGCTVSAGTQHTLNGHFLVQTNTSLETSSRREKLAGAASVHTQSTGWQPAPTWADENWRCWEFISPTSELLSLSAELSGGRKRGRDPLLPNPGWSFPLPSQRTRSCKFLNALHHTTSFFAVAKDVIQVPHVTRGQGHYFWAAFPSTGKPARSDGDVYLASSAVSWLGREALLFYSPLPGRSVTCLMAVRGGMWASSQLWPSARQPGGLPGPGLSCECSGHTISTVPSQQDSSTELL